MSDSTIRVSKYEELGCQPKLDPFLNMQREVCQPHPKSVFSLLDWTFSKKIWKRCNGGGCGTCILYTVVHIHNVCSCSTRTYIHVWEFPLTSWLYCGLNGGGGWGIKMCNPQKMLIFTGRGLRGVINGWKKRVDCTVEYTEISGGKTVKVCGNGHACVQRGWGLANGGKEGLHRAAENIGTLPREFVQHWGGNLYSTEKGICTALRRKFVQRWGANL